MVHHMEGTEHAAHPEGYIQHYQDDSFSVAKAAGIFAGGLLTLFIVYRILLLNDRWMFSALRLDFMGNIVLITTCTLYNWAADWITFGVYLHTGMNVFATFQFLLLIVPPLLNWAFWRYSAERVPLSAAPFYVIQGHLYMGVWESWTTGRRQFRLVMGIVVEACFETFYTSAMSAYSLCIAHGFFRAQPPVHAFGHDFHPFSLLRGSFLASMLNLGKVLALDLDYYGFQRLELPIGSTVQAYRWVDESKSKQRETAVVRHEKDYCVELEFTKDHECQEVPSGWLDVNRSEEVSLFRKVLRLIFRISEITHSVLILAAFAALCRKEELDMHHNGNVWPFILISIDFCLMMWLVRSIGNRQLNWFFACLFIVASPPLMFPQFRQIQMHHFGYRILQMIACVSIVLVKDGQEQVMRRLELVPVIRKELLIATIIYIVLVPVEYYLELYVPTSQKDVYGGAASANNNKVHEVTPPGSPASPRGSREVATDSRYLRLQATDEDDCIENVPRIMRAAIVDDNRVLVEMLAQISLEPGTLKYALIARSSAKVIQELFECGAEVFEGIFDVAVKDNVDCSAEVLGRLLEAGAEPASFPLRHIIERSYLDKNGNSDVNGLLGGRAFSAKGPSRQTKEIKSLLAARAAVFDDVMQQADFHRLDNEALMALLECGGQPSWLPLRSSLQRKESSNVVMELLKARATVYGEDHCRSGMQGQQGVMDTAKDYLGKDGGLKLTVELLRLGGQPASSPLKYALQSRRPRSFVDSLLKAKADVFDGVLRHALKSPLSLQLLVSEAVRADLVYGSDICYGESVQDMSQPMSRYWVNSSHNTYLVGRQIAGESKASMYRDVLMRGCKCLEIDIGNGPHGEPEVTHRYSGTTKISLQSVAKEIADHAWDVSKYAVVLSLDVKLNAEQTVRSKEILQEAFGDLLLPSPDNDSDSVLLSPEATHHRIILKGKLYKKVDRHSHGAAEGHGVEDSDSGEGEEGQKDREHHEQKRCSHSGSLSMVKTIYHKATHLFAHHKEIDPELHNKLLDYNHSLYLKGGSLKEKAIFKGETDPLPDVIKLKDRSPLAIGSYTAPKFEGWVRKSSDYMRVYHRTNLSRIYPHGLAIDSSNYNPMPHWTSGAQFVALNFQTSDESMVLNEGLFRWNNGGCGYVLKPNSAVGISDGVKNEDGSISRVGRTETDRLYCGRPMLVKIEGSDGNCGPHDGPSCPSCVKLRSKYCTDAFAAAFPKASVSFRISVLCVFNLPTPTSTTAWGSEKSGATGMWGSEKSNNSAGSGVAEPPDDVLDVEGGEVEASANLHEFTQDYISEKPFNPTNCSVKVSVHNWQKQETVLKCPDKIAAPDEVAATFEVDERDVALVLFEVRRRSAGGRDAVKSSYPLWNLLDKRRCVDGEVTSWVPLWNKDLTPCEDCGLVVVCREL